MGEKRSEEMILAGYFLSRCGVIDPPPQLGTTSWETAYAMFYRRLGGRRDLPTFQRSLRNVRDAFDSHCDNGRKGWYKDGRPAPLARVNLVIFDEWQPRDVQRLWNKVQLSR
jgi:hypothetical protein